LVRRGTEDRGLGLSGSVGGGVVQAERVLQHRVHFVGDVPHRRRAFAALLWPAATTQQLEARRDRLHRLQTRHRLGRDLLRVERGIEGRVARQQS